MLAFGKGYLVVEKCPRKFTDSNRGKSTDPGRRDKLTVGTLCPLEPFQPVVRRLNTRQSREGQD